MADPTPHLTPQAHQALEQLADIVVPAPISRVPQTWGWAVLAVILLALIVWALVRWYQRRKANRYRVEALAELDKLEAQLQNEPARASALIAIPVLLKRVALAAWPRVEVAALSGRQWVAFLHEHAGSTVIPDAAGRLLDDLEYRSTAALNAVNAEDARAFAQFVRTWIEEHEVQHA